MERQGSRMGDLEATGQVRVLKVVLRQNPHGEVSIENREASGQRAIACGRSGCVTTGF